ncbi:hypothetical protein [uncultured Litoreibacter sp.]|uniref:hypothetical protein n=1 Tax=uncultured Litoreibacter sp. TaxID=1392394 RepID=UPI002617B5EA|nr:hypothetical protein [uncultured Litoreibacter sp.]
MGWFGGYDVSDDVQDWIEDSFDWAAMNKIMTPATPLVLPTKAFFPARKGDPDTVVAGLVDNLKDILGLQSLKVTLAPIDDVPPELRHNYQSLGAVAGTWQGDAMGGHIRYDPALISQPMTLISTLAHELMHQRLARSTRDWPGGAEAEELATDLHCITAGLGVIQLAGSEQAGWQGYMRQPSRAHALAVFLARQDMGPDQALAYLPSRAAKYLKRSIKELAR